jgi:stalled ribosome alternative rescue factor ArfA
VTYDIVFFVDIVVGVWYNAAMKKKVTSKPRARVEWNTGQRVHLPKKGKGSYNRKKSKKSS